MIEEVTVEMKTELMDNPNELVLIELKRAHLSESAQKTFCFLQTKVLFNFL